MKKKISTRGAERSGLCCPHCADSKYPCVIMQGTIRGKRSETETGDRKESR